MREFVGYCQKCGKELYCLDGLFNGVIADQEGTIFCFPCHAEEEKKQS